MEPHDKHNPDTLQRRLAALAEATADFIGIADSEGHALYINPAGRQMLGIPKDMDITQLDLADFHPQSNLNVIVQQAIPTAIAKGTWRGESKVLTRNGTEIDVSQVIVAHKQADGNIEFLSTTIRDITEAKAQRQQFETIFTNSLEMICVAGPDGYYKRVNPAMVEVLGFSEEELLSIPYTEIVHPEDLVLLASTPAAIDTIRRNPTSKYTVRNRCKDGTYRWTSWTATIADDGQSIYGIGRDVTVERAQTELRNQLAAIVESSDDAIIGLDLDSMITSWNRGAERMYGYTAQEAVGQPITLLYLPDAPSDLFMEHIKRGSSIEHVETKRRRKDGSVVEEAITISPIYNESGRLIGAAKIARDISDRKKAEVVREQLIRQLRETARFKDEFLAVMSHELRTPLNAMLGLLGIVLMNKALNERDTLMVTRARANSERLLTLINNILDISRIEAGRMDITPSPTSLRKIVDKLRADMAILAEQKHLDFVASVEPSVPELLMVDEDAINKILTNLLGNAFKFTDKGRVILRVWGSPEELAIEVSDTGIGIPVHMREIIFESFRQVDASSTRAHGGSGLGLSIVKNICAVMRGTVRVESEPGQGSTFIVNLPLQLEKVAE